MNNSSFLLLRPFEVAEKIGQRLQKHRIQQNISQADLANRIGVSIPTISNLENGKNITFDVFLNVVFALGLLAELEDLFVQHPASIAEMQKLYKQSGRKRASRKSKND